MVGWFMDGVGSMDRGRIVIVRQEGEAGGMKKVWNGWGNPENRDVEFPDEIVMESRMN